MQGLNRTLVRLGLKRLPNDQIPTDHGKIRVLTSKDKSLFCEHLLRLDPETRRNRFAMLADDAFMLSYAETSFAVDAVIFGYFKGGILRGVAELRPLPEPDVAEAAFSVEKTWRRQGIGAQLMQALLEEASRQHIERIYINCLASNLTMQALARKFSAGFTYQAGDMVGLITAPKARPANWLRQPLSKLLHSSQSSVPST